MQDLKKILQKRFQGESQRAIALSLHVSRNNVSKVFKAADSTQLTWVQFQTMEEPELLELLFPTEKRTVVQVVPDFDYIHKALCKHGTSLRGLWEEYALNAQAASLPYYQRSRFSDLYHEYVHKHNLTMHITHKPGDKTIVDWGGVTMEVVDPLTGEKATAYLFVATLPFSMLSYLEACPTMKTNDWIKCHIHMFEYFKGVSRILVSDNLKTGVIRNRKYEDPTLNKTYHEMADHYDISILPTRVRKPKDKAAVEGSVGTVTRFLIDKLHKRKFFSFDEVNDAIAKQLELFNHKTFQKREGSRWSCYLEEEYEFMQKLPAQPFELSAWKKLTVQLNYHITIDHMNYSVPYEYVGKRVDVRSTSYIIEVFYKNTRICSHKRLYGRQNQYDTTLMHMPENHQLFEWNGARFESWAASIGAATHEVVHKLLCKYNVEEQACKGCVALLKLSDKYTTTRLENACRLALEHISQPSYKNIRLILESGQDKTIKKQDDTKEDQRYAFVRGKEYYGGKLK